MYEFGRFVCLKSTRKSLLLHKDFDARYSITAHNMRALDDDGLIYSKYVEKTHAYVVIVEPYERDERF